MSPAAGTPTWVCWRTRPMAARPSRSGRPGWRSRASTNRGFPDRPRWSGKSRAASWVRRADEGSSSLPVRRRPVLSPDPQAVLDRVRAVCLALAQTDEIISHGIPAFRVAGKMFAYFRHNHHGDDLTVVCVKTTGRDERSEEHT